MSRPARKREAILAGAARLFRRLGYERSSMDRVAREAGVSKATLYRYFPAKGALFLAAVGASAPARIELPASSGGPEDTLRRLAGSILTAASDEDYLSLLRVTFGEGERFPELGRALRAQVVDRMLPALERVMAGWIASGRLRPLDPRLAAQEFIHMIVGYVILTRLMPGGIDWGVTDDQVVDQVVTIFLWGAAPPEVHEQPQAAVPAARAGVPLMGP